MSAPGETMEDDVSDERTQREYTENERRLLTLAVQRQMLLDTAAEAAAVTIRELTAEIAERDKRLREIAAIAELRWDINVAGNHDPEHLLKRIEAIAKGEP